MHDTLDITTGSCLARVVEQIISQYHEFFQVSQLLVILNIKY